MPSSIFEDKEVHIIDASHPQMRFSSLDNIPAISPILEIHCFFDLLQVNETIARQRHLHEMFHSVNISVWK